VFWRRKKSQLEAQKEPLFVVVRSSDEEMQRAYHLAAESLDEFRSHTERSGEHTCAAKLRFRDPNLSERLGEDRFVYLWLAGVTYEEESSLFVGSFFEVPPELLEWHQPGQRLQFEGEDIFDWFVNDDGYLYGGYTMRVARSRLPEGERAAYDTYTGVRQWVRMERN
jgi:uncharacterized protein YegJ (DUF2314 family)